MDADNGITFDEALEIPLADEGAGDLVPAHDDSHDLTYEPEGELHSEGSLSIEQAAHLWSDDNSRSSSPRMLPGSVAAKIDGREVTLAELVQSYSTRERMLHQADQLGTEYEAVQSAAQGVVNAAWELSRFIAEQIPAAPDSVLLHANPMEYTRQKAMHDTALANVAHVLQQAHDAHASAQMIAVRYHDLNLNTENAKLVYHFPETADPGHRREFFNRMLDAAAACGFTREEFERVVDHRMFRLGALALRGLQALGVDEPTTNGTKKQRRNARKQYRRAVTNAVERFMDNPTIENAAEAFDF